jgi:hypothetical protein
MRLRIALNALVLVVAPVITFAIAKSRPVSSPSATAAAPDSIRNQYQALLKQWMDSHPGYSCSFDQPDDPNPTSATCSKTTTGSNISVLSTVYMVLLSSGQTSP